MKHASPNAGQSAAWPASLDNKLYFNPRNTSTNHDHPLPVKHCTHTSFAGCKTTVLREATDAPNVLLPQHTTWPYLGSLCMNNSNWEGRWSIFISSTGCLWPALGKKQNYVLAQRMPFRHFCSCFICHSPHKEQRLKLRGSLLNSRWG